MVLPIDRRALPEPRHPPDAVGTITLLGDLRSALDAPRAASTSSACVAGFTSCITRVTFPSAPITNVERLTPMYFFPAKLLLAPDAVLLGDRVVRVGEQRERQLVLVLELHVRLLVVG